MFVRIASICPQSLKQAIVDCRRLGLRPAAVIPVDLFGQPADIDAIVEIAHEEQKKVLIDGAQSFGAKSCGRRVGCMGDATTTSFFPLSRWDATAMVGLYLLKTTKMLI